MKNGWHLVTPEMAKELLKRNICNYRVYCEAWAKTLAKDMIAGKWIKNGETIVFSKSGVLQDGQHRLHAIIIANTPVWMNLVFDADDTKLYDLNKARNVRNFLQANGYAATTITTSIANIVISGGSCTNKSPAQLTETYCEENFDMLKKAETIVTGKIAKKAACAAIVYCLLRTGEVSETELRTFFKVVNTGNIADCEQNPTSALVLRRQLMEIVGTGHFVQEKQLEITLKAINDFRAGTTRKNNYSYITKNAQRLAQEVYNKDFQVLKAG